MKTQASRAKKTSLNWLPFVLLAVGAVGAGVTGTLLWMQNRPASTPTSTPAVSTVAPAVTASTLREPPAELTAGLTPSQAALTRGNWNYDHEQWEAAIAQYQQAISGGVDNPDVRTDLGNCYRFVDKPQEALKQYRKAQQENPKHEQSLFNQGGLYAFSMKQPARGIAVWRAYLKRFPKGKSVAQVHQLIAKARAQMKKQGKNSL